MHLAPLRLSSHACLQNHRLSETVAQQPPRPHHSLTVSGCLCPNRCDKSVFPTEEIQLITFQMMHLVITVLVKKLGEKVQKCSKKSEKLFRRACCYLAGSLWLEAKLVPPVLLPMAHLPVHRHMVLGDAFPLPSSIRSHRLTLSACHSHRTLAICPTFSGVPPQPSIQLHIASVRTRFLTNTDFPSSERSKRPHSHSIRPV